MFIYAHRQAACLFFGMIISKQITQQGTVTPEPSRLFSAFVFTFYQSFR